MDNKAVLPLMLVFTILVFSSIPYIAASECTEQETISGEMHVVCVDTTPLVEQPDVSTFEKEVRLDPIEPIIAPVPEPYDSEEEPIIIAPAPIGPKPEPIIVTEDEESHEIIGGERDEHGCLGPAGYTWCEAKQKCLRTWEESCPDQQTREELPYDQNEFIGVEFEDPEHTEASVASPVEVFLQAIANLFQGLFGW